MLNTVSSHNDFFTSAGMVQAGVSTVPARGVAPSGKTEIVAYLVDNRRRIADPGLPATGDPKGNQGTKNSTPTKKGGLYMSPHRGHP